MECLITDYGSIYSCFMVCSASRGNFILQQTRGLPFRARLMSFHHANLCKLTPRIKDDNENVYIISINMDAVCCFISYSEYFICKSQRNVLALEMNSAFVYVHLLLPGALQTQIAAMIANALNGQRISSICILYSLLRTKYSRLQ